MAPAAAQQDPNTAARLRLLETTLQELLQRDEERETLIRRLRAELDALRAGQPAPPAVAHTHDHGEPAHATSPTGDLLSTRIGDTTLRFKGLSVDTRIAAGYSSESSSEAIEGLQGGDHDPRQNGFTLQTVDLGMSGALDPYFDAQATVAFFIDPEGETVVELEEAFLTTQSPPGWPELKAGQYFTEFGAFNPTHIHGWDWLDQPFVATRFFGPDGLRGVGARLAWQPSPDIPTKLYFGVQNAKGETASSFLANDEFFEERPIGGRTFRDNFVDGFDELLYSARIAHAFDAGTATHVDLGLSVLYGPNATGRDVDTWIYGADLTVLHRLSGERHLKWQSEVLFRDYEAAADPANGFGSDTLEDYGLYTQLLYGFNPDWAAGLRYEFGSGSGASVGEFASRNDDPFRSTRHRISPLLVWQFAPTAAARLQYNYDHAKHLDDDEAHAIWLGLAWNFGFGQHAHGDGGGHKH